MQRSWETDVASTFCSLTSTSLVTSMPSLRLITLWLQPSMPGCSTNRPRQTRWAAETPTGTFERFEALELMLDPWVPIMQVARQWRSSLLKALFLLFSKALFNRLVPSVNGVRKFSDIQIRRLRVSFSLVHF